MRSPVIIAGRRPGRLVAAVALLGLAALAAGCAGLADPDPDPGAEAPSGGYRCLGTPIPADALSDPRPASDLDTDGQEALRGLEVPPIDSAQWTVASSAPEQLVLIRELDTPEDLGAGDVRTHERMVVEVVDAPNVPNAPAWMMTALGTCALVVDLPGVGSATVTLDPGAPPDPDSPTVSLLVTEMACNSGEDATGRVEVASLEEGTDVVEVVLVVHPRGGDQACPSNPPTPFTLTLEQPLGDRALVDASVVPARAITLPTS